MRRELTRLLPSLTFFALLLGGQWLLRLNRPSHLTVWSLVAFAAWLLAVFIAGTVVHELGHALAVRLAGERVLGIQLGAQLAGVTLNLGSVPVSVGLGLGGSVSFHAHRLSAARLAAIWAAGPAASVLAAPFCLLLPVPRWEAAYLALAALASGLEDLVPGSDADGVSTDGYKLWRTPARLRADAEVRGLLDDPDWQDGPGAADVLINGFRLDVPEAEDRLRELTRQPAALLLSGRQQLDEALALDPDGALVTEAARVLDGGWDALLAAHAT
jgi:hypothetical protein